MNLFRYLLSADGPTLSVIYRTPKYFNKALQEKAKRFFSDEKKVYTWRNGRFEEN